MFDDEIIAVANDSAQADRLATESAVKECYEQHNVNCSIGVNADTFFTDDDGSEYNEDSVTFEQFMSRLEM